MSDIDRLQKALRNAHQAGDTVAAQRFANRIKSMQSSEPQKASASISSRIGDIVDGISVSGNALAFGRALTNPFGVGDHIRAMVGVGDYEDNLDKERQITEQTRQDNPYSTLAGDVAGMAVPATGALKAGATLTNLPKVGPYIGLAGDGAIMGGLDALGRGYDTATGAITGAIGGALSPVLVGAASRLGSGLNEFTQGLFGTGNLSRAENYIKGLIQNSGRSVDEITDAITTARNAGQSEFVLADALGNAGQRSLAGVARTPGPQRQVVEEFLENRQAGQADRIIDALRSNLGSNATAKQAVSKIKDTRRSVTQPLYKAAEDVAGPVNVSGPLNVIDDYNGANFIDEGIAPDSIGSALNKYKRMLSSKDGSMVVDFKKAHRVKKELNAEIEGLSAKQGTKKNALLPLRNALDSTLENASDGYRAANDTYRQYSQLIDSIGEGSQSFKRGGRAEDILDEFNALDNVNKKAFRAGYGDAAIDKVQGRNVDQLPNFRGISRQEQLRTFGGQNLIDTLEREKTMQKTLQQAIGGSRTADNIADQSALAMLDPVMVSQIASGNPTGLLAYGAGRLGDIAKGRNEKTREMIADILLSGPTNQNAQLARIMQSGEVSKEIKDAISRALMAGSVLGSSQVNQ